MGPFICQDDSGFGLFKVLNVVRLLFLLILFHAIFAVFFLLVTVFLMLCIL